MEEKGGKGKKGERKGREKWKGKESRVPTARVIYIFSAGLRSDVQEARLQMREAQKKMSELNAVTLNHSLHSSAVAMLRHCFACWAVLFADFRCKTSFIYLFPIGLLLLFKSYCTVLQTMSHGFFMCILSLELLFLTVDRYCISVFLVC